MYQVHSVTNLADMRLKPSWRGSLCTRLSQAELFTLRLDALGYQQKIAHRFRGGDDLARVLAHKLALAQVPRAAQAPAPVACARAPGLNAQGEIWYDAGKSSAECSRCPPSTAVRASHSVHDVMRGTLGGIAPAHYMMRATHRGHLSGAWAA